MQVSNPNNVKIYNLSAGKSLPEWLTDRRKRALQKQDVDVQRRIELIQDFEMPTVSNCVGVSKDQQYIFTTGVYKPRVRCYDVNQLSMKFERCFDAEVVKFLNIADDYTKLAFLQCDRYLEFHAQHGKYYRTRIPKYGRDFDYHTPSCDLYIVGACPEIYRLNLEQGRFLNSLKTSATQCYCCQFNPVHQLFACGTAEGHVECWDPRVRTCVGKLDCAAGNLLEDIEIEGVPAVTALAFKDGLKMGVGTSTGQVLVYDLRSDKPLLVKDHHYGLPIKDVIFHKQQELVLSCDTRIIKIWEEKTGKPFTSIEPEDTKLNNLCLFPDSGLIFVANEAPKLLTYYIPSLGPAPKWCSFLDSLTEELEESAAPTVYDDYKFVPRTELETLGLTHLIGTNLLRAYMHGFFMDARLYNKAKSIAEPFAYAEYRRNKIREKIEENRKNRVQVKKLPAVNRVLAQKLMEQETQPTNNKRKAKEAANLLKDSRFSAMFKDKDFNIDMESEEYRLLNPVVSKLDKVRSVKGQQFEEVEEEEDEEREGRPSSEEDSSDDEHTWTAEVKRQHKQLQDEQKQKLREERQRERLQLSKPKFYELKEGDASSDKSRKIAKRSLADRLRADEDKGILRTSGHSQGAMEMTFTLKKSERELKRRADMKAHHDERKQLRRSAHEITRTKKSKFFMGKRR